MEREKPQIGDRFRIPWRDYEEATVIESQHVGAEIKIRYESGEVNAVSWGDWQNWIGGRDERICDV